MLYSFCSTGLISNSNCIHNFNGLSYSGQQICSKVDISNQSPHCSVFAAWCHAAKLEQCSDWSVLFGSIFGSISNIIKIILCDFMSDEDKCFKTIMDFFLAVFAPYNFFFVAFTPVVYSNFNSSCILWQTAIFIEDKVHMFVK